MTREQFCGAVIVLNKVHEMKDDSVSSTRKWVELQIFVFLEVNV